MSVSVSQTRPAAATIGSLLVLAIGLLGLVAIFWPECRAAVTVWIDSTAYGHCFLVAPIAAYIAWDRRDMLHGLQPRPAPAFLLLGLPLPLAWLAAERLGIMEGRQLVALATLELLFLAILGWRLFRALLGPLLYLVFLVPFGAFLTPLLQAFTAHFIDIGLSLIGIPHYVTDMTIEISAGTFYVAEACAGLRFLIASIAFGVFFALLNYNSPRRRITFIAASMAIPILANGLRALGIVTLGNILGSAEAAAADHIIYGWVFFSVVMLLLVACGLPFREPLPDLPPAQSRRAAPPVHARPWPVLLVLALAAIGPAAALALDSRATPPRLLATPSFTAPAGCAIGPVARPGPDQATATMQCGDHAWTITLLALPARATAAAVTGARQRLIGDLDGDEVVTANVPGASGWRSVVSHIPSQVTGLAAWVDGHPAAGGLSQRIQQARASIFGATHAPAVLGVTDIPPAPVSQTELRAMTTQLEAFIKAQPDLDTQIENLTRTP